MNSALKFLSLAIPVLFLAGFILYYFIFNIYEIEVTVSPKIVFADPSCEIQIEIKPINALGWKVPFRTETGNFKIVKGINIVEIIKVKEDVGMFILRSKGIEGIVGIYIESDFSLFPTYVEISLLSKQV